MTGTVLVFIGYFQSAEQNVFDSALQQFDIFTDIDSGHWKQIADEHIYSILIHIVS